MPNRPPSEGVAYRLGSSIIKTASPKKGYVMPLALVSGIKEAEPHLAEQLLHSGIVFLESIIYRLRNTLNGNRPSWSFDPGPALSGIVKDLDFT